MKTLTLILMRHGKAEKDGPSDHDRVLADRGRDQSQSVGKTLRKTFGHIDRAIVSDAARTRQTLAGVISELPIHRVIFEPKLYTINNQREFCHAITQNISNAEKTLLIIGHNPSISLLASNYTDHGIELATGEFVIATMDASDWPTALESSGCWSLK